VRSLAAERPHRGRGLDGFRRGGEAGADLAQRHASLLRLAEKTERGAELEECCGRTGPVRRPREGVEIGARRARGVALLGQRLAAQEVRLARQGTARVGLREGRKLVSGAAKVTGIERRLRPIEVRLFADGKLWGGARCGRGGRRNDGRGGRGAGIAAKALRDGKARGVAALLQFAQS